MEVNMKEVIRLLSVRNCRSCVNENQSLGTSIVCNNCIVSTVKSDFVELLPKWEPKEAFE